MILNAALTASTDANPISDTTISLKITNKYTGDVLFNDKKTSTLGVGVNNFAFTLPEELKKQGLKNILAEISLTKDNKILDSEITTLKKDFAEINSDKNYFSDISNSKYKDSINELARMGIVSGYEDKTFSPDSSITRAEFSALVLKMLNKTDEAMKDTDKSAFKDVSDTHWATKIINFATKNNLFVGYGSGLFKPSDTVSFAEILAVSLRIVEPDASKIKSLSWPDGVVNKAVELQIIGTSHSDASSKPSRGEIANIVLNVMKLKNYTK